MIFWASDGSDTCKSFKITGGSASGSCCTSDETPLVLGKASDVSVTNLCHFQLRFIWCRCWSNISLNCCFQSLQKLNKKGNWYFKAENICSVKYVTILLSLSAPLTDCCFADATTAARIDGKVVISSWTSRRWPSVVHQDGGILTYFDDPCKIEDLTKSKKFLQHITGTPKNKLHHFSEKILVLGALQGMYPSTKLKFLSIFREERHYEGDQKLFDNVNKYFLSIGQKAKVVWQCKQYAVCSMQYAANKQ